jgi:hypothetical protein
MKLKVEFLPVLHLVIRDRSVQVSDILRLIELIEEDDEPIAICKPEDEFIGDYLVEIGALSMNTEGYIRGTWFDEFCSELNTECEKAMKGYDIQ